MNTLTKEALAKEIWFDEDNLWLRLHDGRQIGVPLVYFPRLLKATKAQREAFETSGNGRGLHWPDLDEDILVEGLIHGVPDLTRKK